MKDWTPGPAGADGALSHEAGFLQRSWWAKPVFGPFQSVATAYALRATSRDVGSPLVRSRGNRVALTSPNECTPRPMRSQPSGPDRIDWKLAVALTIAVVSWALAWVSIRVAIKFYTPGQLALGRYLVALLVLTPLVLVRRPRFELRDWPRIFVAGLLGFTFYNLAINAGERTVTAGAAALIASIIPVLSTLGAHIFFGERIGKATIQGGLLALFGVVLISFGGPGGVRLAAGALLIVLAAFCSAGYMLMQKPLVARYAAVDVTTAAIACAVVGLLPFGSGLGGAFRHASVDATANLVVLGVLPGAASYVLWMYCISRLPMGRLMMFLYLVAPLSVVFAWALLGEVPTPLELVGGVVTLCGVVAATSNRSG